MKGSRGTFFTPNQTIPGIIFLTQKPYIGMGTGKLRPDERDIKEELKKAKSAYKSQELKTAQLEQLTYLNKELLAKLKATEKSHRSLMKYIREMHRNLEENDHRTAIEEIWHRELDRFLRNIGNTLLR